MPKRILQGLITSNASDKTVTVLVQRRISHPVYRKFITLSKKYAAHDEFNNCEVGQKVFIEECKPISKRKCWKVMNKVDDQVPTQVEHND